MQNQLQPQSERPLSEVFWEALADAAKEVAPKVYEAVWEYYSPKTYSNFKAAQQLEPHLTPQGKRVLDAFVGFSTVVGAAEIGVGLSRSLQLCNPPYAKPIKPYAKQIKKKKIKRHS